MSTTFYSWKNLSACSDVTASKVPKTSLWHFLCFKFLFNIRIAVKWYWPIHLISQALVEASEHSDRKQPGGGRWCGCCFGYRWYIKYDPGNPVWVPDPWVLIRWQNTAQLFIIQWKDFTTVYACYKVSDQEYGPAPIWLRLAWRCIAQVELSPLRWDPCRNALSPTPSVEPMMSVL